MQGARGLSGPILRRRSPPYCCTSSLAVSLRSRPCRSLLRVRRSSISLRAAWIGSKGSGVSGIAFGGGASSIRGSGWAPSGPVSPAPGSTEPPRAVRHALKRRRRSQTRIPMGGAWRFAMHVRRSALTPARRLASSACRGRPPRRASCALCLRRARGTPHHPRRHQHRRLAHGCAQAPPLVWAVAASAVAAQLHAPVRGTTCRGHDCPALSILRRPCASPNAGRGSPVDQQRAGVKRAHVWGYPRIEKIPGVLES